MIELLWWIFASLAVLGGVGMIARKNPVGSLLSLVLSFFSLAVIYVLLGAHFIAAVQVIVYAGAIMVLFLFVIMLLNLGHDYRADLRGAGWMLAGAVAAGFIGWVIARAALEEGALVQQGGAVLIAEAVEDVNAVGAIAFPLFRAYMLPFEITGLLLLVAIVGAVILAKRRV